MTESDAKTTKVKVTARPRATPPWADFSMSATYPEKGGKQDGDKLKFDERAGNFDIEFTLNDKTALELAFYPSFEEAMWVAVGDSEPDGPGNGNGAIAPVSVSDDVLVVTNNNSVAETLTFILRFTGIGTKSVGYPPYVYDPKIVNGGDPPLSEGEDEDDDRSGDQDG